MAARTRSHAGGRYALAGVRHGLNLYRLFTASMRLLPDFLIIGAQKCGTTSLYHSLTEHPCIAPASRKEVHFFDHHFMRGLEWYRAHFPLLPYKYYAERVRGRKLLTGESSPYYLFHPHAARRVAHIVPYVKLVVLLRDPVGRAYSHYQHEVRKGRETASFEEAIQREVQWIDREGARMRSDATYQSLSHQHYSYLARGLYADQLTAWLDVFPREQLLILKSEDLFADPQAVVSRVLGFLGLPSWALSRHQPYNRGTYPEMADAVRARLREYFRLPNQQLSELLGGEFTWDS